MIKTTVKPTEDSRAIKKITTKQLKIKNSGTVPSADEEKLPKSKRKNSHVAGSFWKFCFRICVIHSSLPGLLTK